MVDALYTCALCLAIGVTSGVASSAPPGPVDLWIANAVLPPRRPVRNVVSFVLGVVVVDLVYAFVAFWGYYTWLEGEGVQRWMGVIGGLGLIALGLYELRQLRAEVAPRDRGPAPVPDHHALQDFLVGAFMCGSTPAFVLFWVFVAAQADAWGVDDLRSWQASFVFLGIALGDLLWYLSFMVLVRKGASYLSERLVHGTRLAIAVGFLALGATALVPALWGGA